MYMHYMNYMFMQYLKDSTQSQLKTNILETAPDKSLQPST